MANRKWKVIINIFYMGQLVDTMHHGLIFFTDWMRWIVKAGSTEFQQFCLTGQGSFMIGNNHFPASVDHLCVQRLYIHQRRHCYPPSNASADSDKIWGFHWVK